MKLNKFAYLYLKPLGNHTLKIMKKAPGNLLKNLEKSWNFVSPKKWEPWTGVWACEPQPPLPNSLSCSVPFFYTIFVAPRISPIFANYWRLMRLVH